MAPVEPAECCTPPMISLTERTLKVQRALTADMGQRYRRFGAYNVAGALLWTVMFVGAGFFLGNLPAVKHNFTLVVLGIVVVRIGSPHAVKAFPVHAVLAAQGRWTDGLSSSQTWRRVPSDTYPMMPHEHPLPYRP